MPELNRNKKNNWATKKRRFSVGKNIYNSVQWRTLRRHILNRQPICVICNRSPSTVADHIVPVRLGGSFTNVENIQGLCEICHNKKSANEKKLR